MSTFIFSDKHSLFDVSDIYIIQYFKELYKMKMYFMIICKAVDMAPQPIRCLWSGANKHFKKTHQKQLN